MKRCYYETLRCDKNATVEELKSSYRKLAKELHPDRNPGDHTAEVKFKEINEAYDVLKDPQSVIDFHRGRTRGANPPLAIEATVSAVERLLERGRFGKRKV